MTDLRGPAVSVRVAWPADATGIADLQLRSWYGDRLAAHLAELGVGQDALVTGVARSLAQPPEARYRGLVALADQDVVGVAFTGPATDEDAEPAADGEILEFLVDPDATRAGHGSRLLQACADTLVADGFTRASYWIRTTDDPTRAFFESAGWAADGATRELADPTGFQLKQLRLHTALA